MKIILLVLGTRVRRTPSATKTSAKKVKKRNPWSDDESKSESDLEENDPVIIPRDSLLRRAAGSNGNIYNLAKSFSFIL